MFEIRACRRCSRVQAIPMAVCRGCGGTAFADCALPFRGTVYSHTTVSRAPSPEFAANVPYIAVLVQAAAGGLLLLPLEGGGSPQIGNAVVVQAAADRVVATLA